MGMYINLFKKKGNNFVDSCLWKDEKYSMNEDAFNIIAKDGECIDKTQLYSDLEQYWRPKNFSKCYKQIQELEINRDIFVDLLDKMHEDKSLYVSYY